MNVGERVGLNTGLLHMHHGMLGGFEVCVQALLCSLDHIQSNWRTCDEQGKHLCQSRVD